MPVAAIVAMMAFRAVIQGSKLCPPVCLATGFGVHRGAMVFATWEAGDVPMEPVGFPLADWPWRIGDIPTLGRGITLAMPCGPGRVECSHGRDEVARSVHGQVRLRHRR